MKNLRKTQWVKRCAAAGLLIMCCAASTQAQALSKDATQEETITFIDEHKVYLQTTCICINSPCRVLIGADKLYMIDYFSIAMMTEDGASSFTVYEASLRNIKAVKKYYKKKELIGIKLKFRREDVRTLDYVTHNLDHSEMKSLVKTVDIEELENYLSTPYNANDRRGTHVRRSPPFHFYAFDDTEMGERLVKAFKHLIYLSKQRR